MSVATPSDVLSWNIDSLRELSTRAAAIADAMVGTSKTMRDTMYDLGWTGDGRRAAEDRAEREREQIGAVASGYDALSAAAAGAHGGDVASRFRDSFDHSELRDSPPVTLSDSWVVDGVEDWSSEAGLQLARLGGLVSSLVGADATWGCRGRRGEPDSRDHGARGSTDVCARGDRGLQTTESARRSGAHACLCGCLRGDLRARTIWPGRLEDCRGAESEQLRPEIPRRGTRNQGRAHRTGARARCCTRSTVHTGGRGVQCSALRPGGTIGQRFRTSTRSMPVSSCTWTTRTA